MNLRHLQFLIALAKHKHFARAAEACNVSQPTLSAAIRQLEQDLQAPLVKRGHRFRGLTGDGETVLHWARQINAACETMRDHLRDQPEGLSGQLRLSGVPSALPVITILTEKLAQRHPKAVTRIVERTEADLVNEIRSFETDVGLVYGELVTDPTFHRSRPLFKERYILLTPIDGPMADRKSVTWAEVAALPLCLPAEATRNRILIDGLLDVPRHQPLQVETDSLITLCAHVCTGRWSTVMPLAFLYPFGAPRGTAAIMIEGAKGTRELCVATAHAMPLPPLVRDFFRIAEVTDMVHEMRLTLGLPTTAPH